MGLNEQIGTYENSTDFVAPLEAVFFRPLAINLVLGACFLSSWILTSRNNIFVKVFAALFASLLVGFGVLFSCLFLEIYL